MLQTASAPYVTSSLHDRGPKLHQSSESLSPLQSTNTYKLSLVGESAAAAGLSGGVDEHRSYSKHRHSKQHRPYDVKTTEDLPSPPRSRPYDDLSRLVGHSAAGPLTGTRSPAILDGPAGLYHTSGDQTAIPFGSDPAVYRRVMTGAVSPAYRQHHHSQANMAHGYLPFNANSTAIDQGLFYPSAVVAAALQHVDAADTWRTALSQTSSALWPYNSPNMHSLYPCGVGTGGYVGIDSRRKNATRESTSTLKAWLYEHIKNPYPTKGEKIMLAIVTKMTLTQVSTWFANARRRLKKENKMQWSTDDKLDDDDNNEDDDVIDVNNDNEDDDEAQLHPLSEQHLKISVGDDCRSDVHHHLSPATRLPDFDVVQKMSNLTGARGVGSSRCYVSNSVSSPTFDGGSRTSAFHFPPPPSPHSSLLALMSHPHILPAHLNSTSTDNRSSSVKQAVKQNFTLHNSAIDQTHRSGSCVTQDADAEAEPGCNRMTSGYGDLKPPKFRDRPLRSATPDVAKPQPPRIWSLVDVAMSTTNRRHTNDVTTTSRHNTPASAGDILQGTNGAASVSVTPRTFQPWTGSGSLPSQPSMLWDLDGRIPPTGPKASAGTRAKAEPSNRRDIGDLDSQYNLCPSDDVDSETAKQQTTGDKRNEV